MGNNKGATKVRVSGNNTIFTQINAPELQLMIKEWARQNDFKVWQGRPDYPDILAIPYCLSVIDRREVGSDLYQQYLGLNAECKWETDVDPNDGEVIDYSNKSICIMIDDCLSWELPALDMVVRVDMSGENALNLVTSILDVSVHFVSGGCCPQLPSGVMCQIKGSLKH